MDVHKLVSTPKCLVLRAQQRQVHTTCVQVCSMYVHKLVSTPTCLELYESIHCVRNLDKYILHACKYVAYIYQCIYMCSCMLHAHIYRGTACATLTSIHYVRACIVCMHAYNIQELHTYIYTYVRA